MWPSTKNLSIEDAEQLLSLIDQLPKESQSGLDVFLFRRKVYTVLQLKKIFGERADEAEKVLESQIRCAQALKAFDLTES